MPDMPETITIGWTLAEGERAALLERFPPLFAETVAHHVTLAARVAPDTPWPAPAAGEIVGHADDGAGVEALVVAVDGATARPDGGTFHVTWSLGEGRRAVESNAVIAEHGWRAVPGPLPLALTPARLR